MADPFLDGDDDTPDAALLAGAKPGDNATALSISEISAMLKRTVEDRFGHVKLRGELTGVKRAASGHLYCGLKDENAKIDGVMWKGAVARLPFRPEDGIEVIATGKLTIYPGRSSYQIVIERMEIAGEGALLALLEKLKARLGGEGLFDAGRKRLLPFLPKVIGVVTSPTGAVIRDILHRLADRFPSHVIVWPVLVQGQGAAAQVAAAIEGFSALAPDGPVPRPDLVIVARGGGSIEDLWSFNEEAVVRAIAASSIPVISAVGHETDTTLADHAADQRAPTPTAAAEMAVPVRRELAATLDDLAARSGHAMLRRMDRSEERFAVWADRLPRPDALLAPQAQRLDDAGDRLRRGLRQQADAAQTALLRAASGLRPARLEAQLAHAAARLGAIRPLGPLALGRVAKAHEGLAALHRLAQQLHPDGPLARGYVRVTDAGGATLTNRAAAAAAGAMALHFRDGVLAVVARDDGPDDGVPPAQVAPKPVPSRQAAAKARLSADPAAQPKLL